MKNITFIVTEATARDMGYSGNADLVRVNLQVDLSRLSYKARKLAESVWTLERADDLSKVYVTGPTQRELYIKDGRLDELKRYECIYGSEYFDKPTVIVWGWDCLKKHETPEEYFERHVKMIGEAGGFPFQ
ncbi:MAG TPA: hypothetical protein PK733_09925 [Clostridiales bacterium]|nr:hypothetical protein [Clostridiales bacterium]